MFKGYCRAQFEYSAQTDEELGIQEHELLLIIDDSDADWWTAKVKQTEQVGLVPSTYVEPVNQFFTPGFS